MSNTISVIEARLTQALQPTHLEIIDESRHHIGHAGAQNGAGHYQLIISSEAFKAQSAIQNHQLIYKALEGLIPDAIHALKIKILP